MRVVAPPGQSGYSFAEVLERVRPSAVRVSVRQTNGLIGLASGFYVDGVGTVLTADHVVTDADGNLDTELIVVSNANGLDLPYRVALLAGEERAALLVPAQATAGSVSAEIADAYAIGEPVMTLGWPRSEAADGVAIVTQGIIAGVGADGLLVLDMAATHGASGAPVFNQQGQIVGMVKSMGVEGDPFTYASSLAGISFEFK